MASVYKLVFYSRIKMKSGNDLGLISTIEDDDDYNSDVKDESSDEEVKTVLFFLTTREMLSINSCSVLFSTIL